MLALTAVLFVNNLLIQHVVDCTENPRGIRMFGEPPCQATPSLPPHLHIFLASTAAHSSLSYSRLRRSQQALTAVAQLPVRKEVDTTAVSLSRTYVVHRLPVGPNMLLVAQLSMQQHFRQ